jgi:hypothetical protein
MVDRAGEYAEWVVRGKSISELIEELQSFEDQSLMVEISLDDGVSSKPISLVVKSKGRCLLMNSEICEDRADKA